jgi:PAS domain-containing protein
VAEGVRRRHERDANIAKIPILDQRLQEILAELKPNGGKSLRDEVHRLEANGAMNEQRLRTIQNTNTEAGFFETNEAGEWVFVNRFLVSLTNRSSEELLGNGWKNIVDPSARANVSDEWKHAVREKRECIIRFPMVTRLAKAYWVVLHAFPVRPERHEIVLPRYSGSIVLDAARTAATALATGDPV